MVGLPNGVIHVLARYGTFVGREYLGISISFRGSFGGFEYVPNFLFINSIAPLQSLLPYLPFSEQA